MRDEVYFFILPEAKNGMAYTLHVSIRHKSCTTKNTLTYPRTLIRTIAMTFFFKLLATSFYYYYDYINTSSVHE